MPASDEDVLDACLSQLGCGDGVLALRSLESLVLPPDLPPSHLLDERSFDIFEPVLSQLSSPASPACAPIARNLLEGVASVCNPREGFCIIMGALTTHTSPRSHLELLRILPMALSRIVRKRYEFIASCFGSLSVRYLREWPGEEWDAVQEEEGELEQAQHEETQHEQTQHAQAQQTQHDDETRWSKELLGRLIEVAISQAGAIGGSADPARRELPQRDPEQRDRNQAELKESGRLEVVASEGVASQVVASEVVASEVAASEVLASEGVASEVVASEVVAPPALSQPDEASRQVLIGFGLQVI